MNDFNPCCMKRIGELDRQGLEETKKENAKGGPSCEITVSGMCHACGTWWSFNHVHETWVGDKDLGPAPSVEWVDRDSIVRPD